MTLRRICYACDLKPQDKLIEQYRAFHQPGKVWPEVIRHIKGSGIKDMKIYLTGNRLFMVVELIEGYDLGIDRFDVSQDERVQEWEELMWQFQKALPWADPDTKWVQVEEIFSLEDHMSAED